MLEDKECKYPDVWPAKSCMYCKNCPAILINVKTGIASIDCEVWNSDPIKEGCKGTCKYFKEEQKNV